MTGLPIDRCNAPIIKTSEKTEKKECLKCTYCASSIVVRGRFSITKGQPIVCKGNFAPTPLKLGSTQAPFTSTHCSDSPATPPAKYGRAGVWPLRGARLADGSTACRSRVQSRRPSPLSIQRTIIAVYNDYPSGLVANLEYYFIPIVWRDRGDNASVFAKTNKNLIYVFFYPRGKRESAR